MGGDGGALALVILQCGQEVARHGAAVQGQRCDGFGKFAVSEALKPVDTI